MSCNTVPFSFLPSTSRLFLFSMVNSAWMTSSRSRPSNISWQMISTSVGGFSRFCSLWLIMFIIVPGKSPTNTPLGPLSKNALSVKFKTIFVGSKGKSVVLTSLHFELCANVSSTSSLWTRMLNGLSFFSSF